MKLHDLRAIFCIAILSVFSIVHINAQAPKFVNEFLNIGVGADAHGMFGSVAATVDDVTAAYWNPAGLSKIENPLQISAMHASWFGGIANYDYFGAAKVINERNKTVGAISVIRMGIDQIPNTLSLVGPDGSINYDNVTEFSTADFAVLVSLGKALKNTDLNYGVSAKVIHRRIGPFGSAWGFGFDAGIQYELQGFSLGLMARDITTTVNAWSFNLSPENEAILLSTGNDVPISSTEIALPKLVLAAAKRGESGTLSYNVEADLRLSTDGTKAGIASGDRFSLDPTLGVEIGYNELAFLRFGIGNMQNILNEVNSQATQFTLQPNIGVGIDLGRLQIDYALTNVGTVAEALISHVFSAKLDFQSKY